MNNKSVSRHESRRASRNHVFNIIFLAEFHNKDNIIELIDSYYDVLEHEIEKDTQFSELVIDKQFIELEVNGILENLLFIDEKINTYCVGWKISRLAKVDLAILRIALYEIYFEPDIPEGVSVNEAVELSKKYSAEKSPSFINAILTKIVNESKGSKDES